jgi:hypothetical protein
MKRFLINAGVIALLVGSLSSCKKQIASAFANPDAVSTGSLPKLMTGMMINARMRPTYWDMYTWVLRGPGEYSQFTAVSPSAQMYVPNTGYVGSRWDDYYSGSIPSNVSGNSPDYDYNGPGIMGNWRSIQSTYAALTPTEQAQQQVFMNIAKVILCDQTAQVVDIWGDIPFFKAGSLTSDGTITYAPYDKASVIYDTLIAGNPGYQYRDPVRYGGFDQWRQPGGLAALCQFPALAFADAYFLLRSGNCTGWCYDYVEQSHSISDGYQQCAECAIEHEPGYPGI